MPLALSSLESRTRSLKLQVYSSKLEWHAPAGPGPRRPDFHRRNRDRRAHASSSSENPLRPLLVPRPPRAPCRRPPAAPCFVRLVRVRLDYLVSTIDGSSFKYLLGRETRGDVVENNFGRGAGWGANLLLA